MRASGLTESISTREKGSGRVDERVVVAPAGTARKQVTILVPGKMGACPATLLVVLRRDQMRALGERLLDGIERGRLVKPPVQDELTVDIQAHAVGSHRGEGISTLDKAEIALPPYRVIRACYRAIRRVATPIEIDLGIRPDHAGRAAQRDSAVVAARKSVRRRCGAASTRD